MKRTITLFLLLFFYANLFSQINLIKINDNVFEDEYEYIYYSFDFQLKQYFLQDLRISKGAILVTKSDSTQLTVICDIDNDEIIADSVEDKGEFWVFTFGKLNFEYRLSFKTFCIERGKNPPIVETKNKLPSVTTGQKIPYDTLQNLCCNRIQMQKQIEKQGTNIWKNYNEDFKGNENWKTTLKNFIQKKILNVLNYQGNYDIECNISNEGIITNPALIKDKITSEILFEIIFTQNSNPYEEANSFWLLDIDWKLIKKF